MRIKIEIKKRIFLYLYGFKLFIISWKNFLKRIFQEIINIEEDFQKSEGYITMKIVILHQFHLNHDDVEGSKIENKLFII